MKTHTNAQADSVTRARKYGCCGRSDRLRFALVYAVIFGIVSAAFAGCSMTDRDTVQAASRQDAANLSAPRDPSRLWCNEHSLYEDECVICHPELASKAAVTRDPSRLWCNEHSLYEDECTICHPELASDSSLDRHSHSEGAGGLWCSEHDLAEIECGLCHPELVGGLEPGQGMKIRFESDASFAKAGVRTGRPGSSTMFETLEVLGRVTFDRNKLAMVTPLAGGVVERVLVDTGDDVKEGDTMAQIGSPAIAEAKSALVRALTQEELHRQTHAREKDLVERKISAQQDYESARAAYGASRSESQQARQQLLNLGFTESEVAEVVRTRSTTSTMLVRAPFDGTIVERNAVAGSAVETGTPLFQVADLRSMWLELSIPESHIGVLKRGMPVVARFDAYPSDAFDGELTWIAYEVHAETRNIEARAVLPNPDERLRQGMFANVQLAATDRVAGLTVPKDSVQIVDGRSVIFTKHADDLFESRIVRLGPNTEGQVLVLSGLRPDDEIVISESYLVKSELLKARLGAGCTDH